jgi:hypothetical protein
MSFARATIMHQRLSSVSQLPPGGSQSRSADQVQRMMREQQ